MKTPSRILFALRRPRMKPEASARVANLDVKGVAFDVRAKLDVLAGCEIAVADAVRHEFADQEASVLEAGLGRHRDQIIEGTARVGHGLRPRDKPKIDHAHDLVFPPTPWTDRSRRSPLPSSRSLVTRRQGQPTPGTVLEGRNGREGELHSLALVNDAKLKLQRVEQSPTIVGAHTSR